MDRYDYTAFELERWDRLIVALNETMWATESTDGLNVRRSLADGTKRAVEIKVTPKGWGDFLSIFAGGDENTGAGGLIYAIERMPTNHPYLIYTRYYEFVSSRTPTDPRQPRCRD